MEFRIDPCEGMSRVRIFSEKYLGEQFLELDCFENFLEIKTESELWQWNRNQEAVGYTVNTSGAKRGKVTLSVRLCPAPDGIVLDTAVTNRDTHIIDDIKYNTCLKFKHVPAFKDYDGKNVFVWTDEGWLSILDLPCRVAARRWRRMQNYFVKDHEPDGLDNGFMGHWGFCPRPLAKAFIAKLAPESGLAIGLLWDRAFYCRNNMNDSHHCIHSQGQIDDLLPGDTRKRRGKIFFAPDGLDALYEQAAAFFGWA